ncbi:MAG: fimbrillin family protein [Muribaculaceae bacterium]|nr:fimbrillin family protein [Muribaculaceae bacterium]
MKRPYKGLHFIPVIIAAASVMTMTPGCNDDALYDMSGGISDHPVFGVNVASSWHKGDYITRSAETEIEITRLEGDTTDQPLYLVAETNIINDSTVTSPLTRGTKIETAEKFKDTYKSFGLSGICHTGNEDYDLSEMPVNFVHNSEVSEKGSLWEAADKLEWPGSGRLRFFAYAPYATAENGITISPATEKGAPSITFSVKEKVSEQIDLMTAVTDVKGSGKETIDLNFTHALSAIQIKTGNAMLGGTLKSVTISGIYGKGSSTTGSGVWTVAGEANCSYTLEPQENTFSPKDEDNYDYYTEEGNDIAGVNDNLTLFLIPQKLGENAKISIEFTDKLTGTDRKLSASLSGEWKSGKLYTYSLSTTGIVLTPMVKIVKKGTDDYALSDSVSITGIVNDIELAAYIRVSQEGTESIDKKVPFHLEYSTDGTTWAKTSEGIGGETRDIWTPDLTSTRADASGTDENPAATASGTLYFPAQSSFMERHRLFDRSSEQGSENSPENLAANESANCYMINRPGYYKFPTVYGNTLNNENLLNTTPDTKESGMKWFVDHNDKKITQSRIKNQIAPYSESLKDAFLLWQDSPGLIDGVKYDATEDCISFHVGRNTISQGNAVIALRNDKDIIVWSWHIWVTDQDWSQTINIVNKHDKVFKMAPSVLGRCDVCKGDPSRKLHLKVVFSMKDSSGKEIECNKTVDGNDLSEIHQQYMAASMAGDNTYYQWGRKDAMPGGRYGIQNYPYYSPHPSNRRDEVTMLNKDLFDNPAEYAFGRSKETTGVSVGRSIQIPYHFIMGDELPSPQPNYRQHWHNIGAADYMDSGGSMYNIWNFNSKKSYNPTNPPEEDLNGDNVRKTIYDPCPPGYHIPSVIAFNGIVQTSPGPTFNSAYDGRQPVWKDDSRWEIEAPVEGGGKVFLSFYSTGMRNMNFRPGETPRPEDYDKISIPAFSMVSFITSSSLASNKGNPQGYILFFDHRGTSDGKERCGCEIASNNAYGLTVWPARNP